jgi:transcription antitermination factor NusG
LAAFTRGPIRGHIYIEANMSTNILNLLRLTPGIMKRCGEPIVKLIPIEDRTAIICLPADQDLKFVVGQWVQVTKGIYKGDIGYIREIKAWGGVQLLLVPRIQLQVTSLTNKQGKRRRTNPAPDCALFDPSIVETSLHVSPKKKGTSSYFFNGCTFEHGLLVKELDSYSVSSFPVRISSEHHFLFLNSGHQTILKAKFPPPLEWHFCLKELVKVMDGPHKDKLAHIKAIMPELLEVDLSSGEGIIQLPWHKVCKQFVVGDFVKVVGGMHEGRTGWVHSVMESNISIIQRVGTAPVDNCAVMEVSFSLYSQHKL